jgi:hypothetical protein
MRVISHGAFNLCPSEVCNPDSGNSNGARPKTPAPSPVEFLPYAEVPAAAIGTGMRLMEAGGLDVGGIEYLEAGGRLVFYDINANSNLRAPIARAFGFDPFDRVVDFLVAQIDAAGGRPVGKKGRAQAASGVPKRRPS